ncbi:class F sortase [Amycolatopsis sp. Hca4]|uniref:class F sortase n=1 Tax=Amycolatopsis sp. Hca4 TaxID=2742131 RepID=UPI001592890B|nr:class F sortase [Amycolatopsis sp. Hca4]QKV80306.1 class F sortase [Amycolatopsis sp. Hca4]
MNGRRTGGVSRTAGAHRYALAAVAAVAVAVVVGAVVFGAAATPRATGDRPSAASVTGAQPLVGAAPATQAAALPGPEAVIAPTRLIIPAIGVDAPVVPVGVDDTGAFAAPDRVGTVGWYRYGPGLDAPAGSLVIGGHVDSAREGPGAFFRLRRLEPGARLQFTGTDGRTRDYTVTDRRQIPKSAIDLQAYFDTTGSPRITLFTCGGAFDRATRNYEDNIVVTAEPR